MLDFSPSESQQNVRSMLNWLAKEKIRPQSEAADRNHDWPNDFLRELTDMGVSAGSLPENETVGGQKDQKGVKQTNRTSVMAIEELSYGDASVILSLPGPGLGGPPVKIMGTPEQQQRRGP